jgi:hypothetical protein
MAWGTKGIKSPPLLVLNVFYKQRVLMVLQHAHAISILRCALQYNKVRLGEESF